MYPLHQIRFVGDRESDKLIFENFRNPPNACGSSNQMVMVQDK